MRPRRSGRITHIFCLVVALSLAGLPGHAASKAGVATSEFLPIRLPIGAWFIRTNAPDIPELPTVLATFNADGGLTETDIGALVIAPGFGPGIFTEGHGVWKPTAARKFRFRWDKHYYAPEGVVWIGRTRTIGTATMSADGNSWTATVTLEFRNPNNDLLVALPATFQAERITVD
jgi:hypothetical protein